MHLLREGINIGWPYTYYDPIKKAHMVAPEFGGDNRKRDTTSGYDDPVIGFPGHWAPLQMTLYAGTQFPEKYRGGMFVAFHGSWNRAPRSQAGYKVVFVPFNDKGLPTGDYETFADGFAGKEEFRNTSEARFRPCGVAVGPDGSLYVGETEKGRLWRIIYTGETNSAARKLVAASAPNIMDRSPGAQLYQQICAVCHMPDGNGVTGMQPPLNGSAVVAGDPATFIQTVLKGPALVLPADRVKYSNQMPAFGPILSDADVATVLSYIRTQFGKGASPITSAQVAAERGR
jgi:mono/diheme cytochrome c family protein